jgi:hypothetical protein
MTGATATILAAIGAASIVIIGGLLRVSGRLGVIEEALRELRRRVQRSEVKEDQRDQRNEGRRDRGE